MDLEDTTPSGVSQPPKDRPGLTAFIGNVYKRPIRGDRKRVRGRQERDRRDGALLLPDTVSPWGSGKVLEIVVMAAQRCKCTQGH